MTTFASWLNTAFAGFDHAILSFYHTLAEHAGWILTPFLKLISLVGEKGILCFVIALICLLFPKTRKIGVCIVLAVGVGGLLTNLTIKDLVARPRPFQSGVAEFAAWWTDIGSPSVSEFSFPSGHTTSAVAGMTVLCLFSNKKLRVILPAVSYALLTGISRNYLMVHYPTDVIAGFLVGTVAALTAFGMTTLLYFLLEKKKETKLVRFALEFDIRNCFRKKNKKET